MIKEIEVDVPDSIRPYLNEIAQRLWAGRAAVMVGAGFSKNAGRGFLDWNELGDLFYQKAHGVKPDPSKQKYLNVLRLAEEVQAAIGPLALYKLIQSNTPDRSVEPSELHVELLKLPWSDVFTTNYDTLLERASAKVDNRRYEPVVNKEDIPYADKPRIVKLHGSFPSERPFIITEEDFRRYPHDYAPFVNTVQQALLENTFCLVGFSGDDPNFLQWIGWLRDNLGKDKTQKIYLVGLFDLPSARLQLLAQRGIIVVDFSCCDDIEKHDHKKALKRFFEYMQSWRPDGLDWPYKPNFMQPTGGTTRIDEFRKITEEWRHQRHSYPGWLLLPHGNRESLWAYTDTWINYLPNTEELPRGLDVQYAFELIWRLERCLLPIFDNIAELCEKLLEKYWPFQSGNPPAHCQFHVKDDEFQNLPWGDIREAWLYIALEMLRFYREEGVLDRRRSLETRLRTIIEELSTEQREFLSYEEYLFSLFNLDLPKATRCLENWRPNESQPYWMTKRAASLAEIGHLIDTEEQIRLSLVETRRKSNSDTLTSGLLSVSSEAYQMLLLQFVGDAGHWTLDRPATSEEEQRIKEDLGFEWSKRKKELELESERHPNSTIKPPEFSNFEDEWENLYENRYTDTAAEWNKRLRTVRDDLRRSELQQKNARWDEIKAFRCDPWNELKLYELTLDRPLAQQKSITKKRGFDIGQVSRTHHLHGNDREVLRAYSFLRFCEEIGLPYRIGSFTMATKTALGSLRRISRTSSFWATATLARLGDSKAVDSLFNRESVFKFTANEADHLIQSYLDAIDKCRGDIHAGDAFRNNNFGVRLAQLLPEIISRLCCKCSLSMKYKILDFIAELYASPDKSKYGNVKNLTKRLIVSLSDLEQYALIPTLLKIPIPDDLSLIVKDEFWNPFLLLDVDKQPESAPDFEIQPGLVFDLLRESVSDNAGRRRWAISSLIALHNLQLLDNDQTKELGDAIWQIVDGNNLPAHTDYYKFAFLQLPHPEGIDPSSLFKSYVRATSFPIQKSRQKTGISLTGGNIPLVSEIIRASNTVENLWTAEDATDILHRLLEWWDADKERLDEKERESPWISVRDEFRSRFARLVEVLAEVVGPKLGPDSPRDVKSKLSRLLTEIREHALPVLVAEAACLHINPGLKKNICSRINGALISNQVGIEIDALRAIGKIIANDAGAASKTLKSEVTLMLGQYLTWCPIRSVGSALGIVARIVNNSSSGFTGELEAATLKRLERLLTETRFNNDKTEIDFEEKLDLRETASVLASSLWEYYDKSNLPVPKVLEDWRAQCLSPDEFPEVRNVWLT